MIVKIRNYINGIHNLEFEKNAEAMGLKEPFNGKVKLSTKMDKSSHQIVFDCYLECDSSFECDRCTVEYSEILKSNFELVYIFDEKETHSDNINVNFISPEADKIDLTKDVIEYCKLSIPLKKLCNENCKGLCSICGQNLNEKNCNCKEEKIDPKWEPLLKLKDKLN